MTVWIVMRGELREGGRVLGVYATRAAAVERTLAEECHSPGGWISGLDPCGRTSGDENCWWDGECDWVSAEPWAVQ